MAAFTTVDDPTIYVGTTLYTGNQSTVTLTMDDIGWLWMKRRGSDIRNVLFDNVRGGHYTGSGYKPVLVSDADSASQGTDIDSAAKGVTFASAQTVIGNDQHGYSYNRSGHSMVAWHWATGTSFSNDASATSVGSIDSAGTVNTTAGFSIIGYTGAGDGTSSSAQTIAHGLGVAPSMIIVKNLADSTNWFTYHHRNTSAPATDVLYLNLTNATGDDNGPWNDTAPTSSVFTVGGDNGTNGNGDSMIAYCFAEKQGYSKFGTYIGNGNVDGTFIYLGFKPAWFMIKSSSNAEQWEIVDNVRDPFNPVNQVLVANSDAEETTGGTGNRIYCDFLSNGVKLRGNASQANGSGLTFVYMAFAEMPFVNSNGVPGTAR